MIMRSITCEQLLRIVYEVLQGRANDEVLAPDVVFKIAADLCSAGYLAQKVEPSDDLAEDRDHEHTARKKRGASGFEALYCRIRDMANDWHREATRRHAGLEVGQYHKRDLDAQACDDATFALVEERIADWDY